MFSAHSSWLRAEGLVNPGFEQADARGNPAGWHVLSGLDEARYGPPDHEFTFDDVKPVVTAPGRGGAGHALAFPGRGAWPCKVGGHDRGKIGDVISPLPGSRRGKAAVYQVVGLPAGKYRFGVFLRTADGDGWSGAFSLGVATNGTSEYAHDDSTGITWTGHDLAMRGDPSGDYPEWGEWKRHTSAPFKLTEMSTVSVWVRFNYVNQHQMNVRWEVDDAVIERLPDEPFSREVIQAVTWTGTGAWVVGDIANFGLRLDLTTTPQWRRLEIRFREAADRRDGFVLSMASGGDVRLSSIADGVIHTQDGHRVEGAFPIRLSARGQYLRADLPGDDSFESRIIGPQRGRLSLRIVPPGSARVKIELVSAPHEMPGLPFPVQGEFKKVYDPSVGEERPWYINDHCVLCDGAGIWHMFGITHAEPANPLDEDFFAHATRNRLTDVPWTKRPPVCRVNESAGETHTWAPHIVEKDGVYYMFYCGGGEDHDAYQINLRTSKDLVYWEWFEGNPLFTDIGDARDPMVLGIESGEYLMYYTRPSSVDEPFSSVAVRESTDLVQWSEPTLALVTPRKQRFGRLTESPYVFRYEADEDSAYYLSATGYGGGYRDTRVWRSVDPRSFDADHIVAQIDAHASEWIETNEGPPSHVTHCGWRQGGFFIAPVRWERRPWDVFGLLVVRRAGDRDAAVRIEVRRRDADGDPYRAFWLAGGAASYALPPGRYRVGARLPDGTTVGPVSTEVVADRRVYLDLP